MMDHVQARVTVSKSAFRREYAVEVDIRAPAQRVWDLLTDAAGFPRWNSTVTKIEGEIRDGQKLAIRVPISERTFTPSVSDVKPGQTMTWSDGFAPMFRGVRTFVLTPGDGGVTHFRMAERLSGLMLPMIGGSLPDFGPVFDQYARDLKKEAERS
jgi:uncharacterized protein YndB with AHSA1/START domain